MAVRRRRARNPEGEYLADNPATPEVNEAWVQDEFDPVAYLKLPGVSREDCRKALDLARQVAGSTYGRQMPQDPSGLPHHVQQGIRLLATTLLMRGALSDVPTGREIPAVCRYYFMRPF